MTFKSIDKTIAKFDKRTWSTFRFYFARLIVKIIFLKILLIFLPSQKVAHIENEVYVQLEKEMQNADDKRYLFVCDRAPKKPVYPVNNNPPDLTGNTASFGAVNFGAGKESLHPGQTIVVEWESIYFWCFHLLIIWWDSFSILRN